MSRADSTLFERGLPAAVDLEKLVLGAALIDPQSLLSAVAVLEPGDFSTEAHRRIFAAIVTMHEASRPVDRPTVAQHLRDAGQLESVGGLSYIVSLDDGLPELFHLDDYLVTIRNKAQIRRAIIACAEIQERLFLASGDSQAALAEAEATLQAVAQRGASTGGQLRPVGDVFTEHGVEGVLYPQQHAAVATYPWAGLNAMLGGIQPGTLTILAARPGVGKSSMATEIAVHVARAWRGRPAFFSLEMPDKQIMARMCCQMAGESTRNGGIEARRRLAAAASELSELPIYIDDRTGSTVASIRAAVQRLSGVSLIIIDYLQLMTGAGRSNNRNEEVASISRGLMHLVRQTNIPVLALSQLSRDSTKVGREPGLSDLRDSGALEQDAHAVIFLHPADENDRSLVADVKAIVKKNRSGPVGRESLMFHRATCRFISGEHE